MNSKPQTLTLKPRIPVQTLKTINVSKHVYNAIRAFVESSIKSFKCYQYPESSEWWCEKPSGVNQQYTLTVMPSKKIGGQGKVLAEGIVIQRGSVTIYVWTVSHSAEVKPLTIEIPSEGIEVSEGFEEIAFLPREPVPFARPVRAIEVIEQLQKLVEW